MAATGPIPVLVPLPPAPGACPGPIVSGRWAPSWATVSDPASHTLLTAPTTQSASPPACLCLHEPAPNRSHEVQITDAQPVPSKIAESIKTISQAWSGPVEPPVALLTAAPTQRQGSRFSQTPTSWEQRPRWHRAGKGWPSLTNAPGCGRQTDHWARD